MKSQNKNSLLLLALFCLPGGAHALSSDREQPIFIEADEVEIDKLKGFSRYQGNVKFVQGSLIIRGEVILLTHKDGVIDKVVIDGEPATFQQMPDKGAATIVSHAHKMEYYAKQSRLYLFNSARVSQGNNSFSGEKIEYDIVNSTVIANKGVSGGNRVNAILEEEPNKKTP